MRRQQTPLVDLAREGKARQVKTWLARHSAEKHANEIGEALVMAAKEGEVSVLELLLPYVSESQADIAFNSAAFQDRLDSVRALMKSPLIDPKKNNSLVLQNAIEGGNPRVVAFLLDYCESNQPLFLGLAAKAPYESVTLLEILITRIDPKAENSWALSAAAEKGNLPALHYLVDKCDPEASARHLAGIAQTLDQMADPSSPNSIWQPLQCLALAVPTVQARIWVEKYGVEHFPEWVARNRQDKVMIEPSSAPIVGRRPRPRS